MWNSVISVQFPTPCFLDQLQFNVRGISLSYSQTKGKKRKMEKTDLRNLLVIMYLLIYFNWGNMRKGRMVWTTSLQKEAVIYMWCFEVSYVKKIQGTILPCPRWSSRNDCVQESVAAVSLLSLQFILYKNFCSYTLSAYWKEKTSSEGEVLDNKLSEVVIVATTVETM